MVMASLPTRDSAVSPCSHGSPAFLHRHFPPQSPPSHPPDPSLRINSSPCWGLLHSLYTPAPSCCTIWGMYGCGKDCRTLIPFRLPQVSCFTLSLKCFSSDSDSCLGVGIRPLLQFPHFPRAGPVLLTLLFSPQPLRPAMFCGGL